MNPKVLDVKSTHDLAVRLEVSEASLQEIARSMPKHVRPFRQAKTDGGYRQLYDPSIELKAIQRAINKRLLQPIPLPEEFHGGVPGKSTVTNARPHTRKALVAKIDIKDFYPTIHPVRVNALFVNLGCAPDVSRLLTRLTTYRFQLAQGFPTSPAIANLVLAAFWPRIMGLCRANGVAPSVFLDDLNFSGSANVERTIKFASRILTEKGFKINQNKTELASQDKEQIVTGWRVNDGIEPKPEKVREIRAMLRQWDVNGINAVADRPVKVFARHVHGLIAYIMQGDRDTGIRLFRKFNRLCDRDIGGDQPHF